MDEPARLFLIRHGQTAWNAEMRMQGQLDLPLDATGLWQAERVAQALHGETLTAIYCSDLQRARQTAAPLAAALGLSLELEAGLRERHFGEFQGHSYADIEQRWPLQVQRWRQRDPDFGPAGGETLTVFYERSVQTVLRLAAAHGGQSIALFAHGGVLDCIYRAATHLSLQAPRTWQLNNATINRLLWTPQGLSIVGWNDAQHLEGGADR